MCRFVVAEGKLSESLQWQKIGLKHFAVAVGKEGNKVSFFFFLTLGMTHRSSIGSF